MLSQVLIIVYFGFFLMIFAVVSSSKLFTNRVLESNGCDQSSYKEDQFHSLLDQQRTVMSTFFQYLYVTIACTVPDFIKFFLNDCGNLLILMGLQRENTPY